MTDILQNLKQVNRQLTEAALSNGRSPEDVTLIAVSKTKPSASILKAFACGQREFGENYLQEAQVKITELSHLSLVWHFLGPIQSNKTRQIAELFDWVHSIERLKIAQRLSEQRPPGRPPLNVCLQVNIDQDPNKAGCSQAQAAALAQHIATLPNLKLKGLMAIPKPHSTVCPFAQLAQLQRQINRDCGLDLAVLSMGMSADMNSAIAAGATHVRIGTAIFGSRDS